MAVPDGATADVPADVAQVNVPCATTTSIPGSVTIAGETFTYTAVANVTSPVANAAVVVLDSSNAVLGATTGDASGAYSLSVDLGGAPQSFSIKYAPPGYWTTHIYPDVPLDHSILGPNMDRWRLGDGPIWGDGEMGSVYGSVGLSIDAARGTINIAVRDCSEDVIEGVSFDVQPPPERLSYIDASGNISSTLTSTIAPYTSAIALNAQAGPTHITASKAGLAFLEMDLDVPAGNVVTYPAFHPL